MTGEPVYDPLMFGLFELRGVGGATNTLLQALRSVMLFLLVLDELEVDLERRLREGRLLDLAELESIARACSLALREVQENDVGASPSRPSVIKLREAVRMRTRVKPLDEVHPSTKAVRLHYTGRRLLDRTLIYTAVTRAQTQVIVVGDEAAARAAVEGARRAVSRQVSLDLLVRRELASAAS